MNTQKFRALLTGMLLWVMALCTGSPVLALASSPLVFHLPLTQQIDVPEGLTAEQVTVRYSLVPVDGAPLPEGAAGESLSFSLRGNEATELLFRFSAEGYYTYTLRTVAVEGAEPDYVSAAQETYTLKVAAFSPETTAALYGGNGKKCSNLYVSIATPPDPNPAEPPKPANPTPESTESPKPGNTTTPTTAATASPTPAVTVAPTSAVAPGQAGTASAVAVPKTGDPGRRKEWLLLFCAAGACLLLLRLQVSQHRAHGGKK